MLAIALEKLAALDWTAGKLARSTHDDASNKQLCLANGFPKRPTYFNVLLTLEDDFEAGLKYLPCDHPGPCYVLLQLVEDKSSIPLDLGWNQYICLVQCHNYGVQLCLEDLPRAKRARGDRDDQPLVVHSVAIADQAPAAVEAPLAPLLKDRDLSSDEDDDVPRRVCLPRGDPSCGAGGSVDGDGPLVSLPRLPESAEQVFNQLVLQASAPELPRYVEDVIVKLQSRLRPSHGPPYVRKYF